MVTCFSDFVAFTACSSGAGVRLVQLAASSSSAFWRSRCPAWKALCSFALALRLFARVADSVERFELVDLVL